MVVGDSGLCIIVSCGCTANRQDRGKASPKACRPGSYLGRLPTGAILRFSFVSLGTNWLAQAEHGGYYQAIADGTYEKYGLKVTVRQGGPQGANRALLTGGQIQFYMGGMTTAIDAVKEGIPTLTLAAIFQKDPQVLLAHPDA